MIAAISFQSNVTGGAEANVNPSFEIVSDPIFNRVAEEPSKSMTFSTVFSLWIGSSEGCLFGVGIADGGMKAFNGS